MGDETLPETRWLQDDELPELKIPPLHATLIARAALRPECAYACANTNTFRSRSCARILMAKWR